MKFQFAHYNYNVMDLDKSIRFYQEALGLREVRRKEASDGSFTLVYLGDGATGFQLELTWLRDWEKDHYDRGIMRFTWPLRWMIWRLPIRSIRRWDASAMKIRKWGFILFRIPMGTGWKSFRQNSVVVEWMIEFRRNIH